MNKKNRSLLLFVIATFILSATGVMAAYSFRGSGTATGRVTKDGQSHARVGKSNQRLGKVYVASVTVTDKFGRERDVEFRYVGGKGTSRPTIKFIGNNRPKKNEFVTLNLDFKADVELDVPLDAHIY